MNCPRCGGSAIRSFTISEMLSIRKTQQTVGRYIAGGHLLAGLVIALVRAVGGGMMANYRCQQCGKNFKLIQSVFKSR